MLVRPDGGGFYLLDKLGAQVWELCDGQRSVEEVIAAIGQRYYELPATVAGDVREWIAELRVEGLLLGPE